MMQRFKIKRIILREQQRLKVFVVLDLIRVAEIGLKTLSFLDQVCHVFK